MKGCRIVFYFIIFTIETALSACTTIDVPAAEQAEVTSSLAGMAAAANAHDVDRHVGFYAHDASTLLIFDGEAILGWEAIYAKQQEWWSGGKTDVVYTLQGKPDVRVLAPGLVTSTIFLKSRRSTPTGTVKEGSFAVSAIWKKLSDGWKVIYSHESTSH
jgi:ketosteroid isomerase-like protein